MATATLVIMRHGESAWTDKRVNRFAGWVDVPLTERGRAQAAEAGRLMREADIRPDAVFTSLLERSIVSADIALHEVGRLWVPVIRSWRLNERHYGAFQGQTRPDMRKAYGEELFETYRRSFDVRPPEIDPASPYFQADDPRYGALSQDGLDATDPRQIRSECLNAAPSAGADGSCGDARVRGALAHKGGRGRFRGSDPQGERPDGPAPRVRVRDRRYGRASPCGTRSLA